MLSRARDLLRDIIIGSQDADNTRSSFMSLPTELRLKIYTFALCAPVHIAIHPIPQPSVSSSLFFFHKPQPSTSSTLLFCRDQHESDSLEGIKEPGRFEGTQVCLHCEARIGQSDSYCSYCRDDESRVGAVAVDLGYLQENNFIYRSSVAALLATCKTINNEASMIYRRQNVFHFESETTCTFFFGVFTQFGQPAWYKFDLKALSLLMDSHMAILRLLVDIMVECPALSLLRIGLRRDHECDCVNCLDYLSSNRDRMLNSLRNLNTFEIWRHTKVILALNGPPITHPGYAWISRAARQSDREWEGRVRNMMGQSTYQDEGISQDGDIT